MKIDQLPVEMMMKIFSYLPTREEILLVNKRFYSVACEVNEFNIFLRIDRRFLDRVLCKGVASLLWLQSMQISNRKISKVEIQNYFIPFSIEDWQLIIAIVKRFSATIKSLQFKNISMNMSTFLEILSLTPNVECLQLQNLNFLKSYVNEDQSSKQRRCYDALQLKKLESLSIVGLCENISDFFILLPVGILIELRISYFRCNELIALLNRQLNIKKLKLESSQDDDFSENIFEKLNLVSLDVGKLNMNCATIAAILLTQTKLKSLILPSATNVDAPAMNAIEDLLELETLGMNVAKTSVASFRKILKLKDLKLQWYITKALGDVAAFETEMLQTTKFKALAEAHNTSLVKLSMSGIFVISVDLIAKLAKSTPHLKHLDVSGACFLNPRLDGIMSHFNFVEILEISIYELLVNASDNYFNPELMELSIYVEVADIFHQPFLTKLPAAYPNLRKLRLTVDHRVGTPFEINPILKGFLKLESLILRANHRNFPTVVDYIQDHYKNFKFVSLGNGLEKFSFTDDLVNKLRGNFGAVNVDRFGHLNMAIDQHTMNCEC